MTPVTLKTNVSSAFELCKVVVEGPCGREEFHLSGEEVRDAKAESVSVLLDLVLDNCGTVAFDNLADAVAAGLPVLVDGEEVPAAVVANSFPADAATP